MKAPSGRCDPRSEPRLWPLALALQVALLSGCSGSPFAERLSRSFPAASEPTLPALPSSNDQALPPGAGLSGGGGPGASGFPPGAGATSAGEAAAAVKAGAGGVGPAGRPGATLTGTGTGTGTAATTATATATTATAGSQGKGAGSTPPAAGSPAAGSPTAGSTAKPSGAAKPSDGAKPGNAVGQAVRTNGPGPSNRAGIAPAAEPSNAAPYRVTLRLPRADPAAPAELVTRALRSAGVPFEVETIERMPAPAMAPPATSRKPAPALSTPAR